MNLPNNQQDPLCDQLMDGFCRNCIVENVKCRFCDTEIQVPRISQIWCLTCNQIDLSIVNLCEKCNESHKLH